MPYFWEWFPPLWVGVLFAIVGGLKLYGLYKGIEGGAWGRVAYGRQINFDRANRVFPKPRA